MPAKTMATDKRALIVKCATELFAPRGFDKVSLKEIAGAARILPGSLYHFFPSKQTLYIAVVNAAFEFHNDQLLPAIEKRDTPHNRLVQFFSILTRLFAGESPQSRIIDRALFEARDRGLAPLAREIFERLHESMTPVIRELTSETLDPAAIDLIISHLFGVAYGTAKLLPIHAQLGAKLASAGGDELARDLTDMVESMLRGGYANAAFDSARAPWMRRPQTRRT